HLEACLASVLEQTTLPIELIVIDDGDLPAPPLRDAFASKGIAYIYRRKEEPGLTESRNLGVSLARGDILCFLDDDVVLEPDFLERTLEVYRSDSEHAIGGVGFGDGATPGSWLLWLRRLYNLVFLISGVRAGRVLPSGFCTNLGEGFVRFRRPMRAFFLGGAAMSYRREVFDRWHFTPGYHQIAVGEDKDFSHRVARGGYELVITPLARLYHAETEEMRPDKRGVGRKFVVGRYLFFREFGPRHPLAWILFWWALGGYLLSRVAVAVATGSARERERVRGIVEAMRDIAAGRLRDALVPAGTALHGGHPAAGPGLSPDPPAPRT
ncbi:MAG TPA: glycosyltransferase family 2 protein, partial [Thermoanaerobaculia bacterium]|nr:glycosyltransferase family 2 protein [Thermoanaerobaculia bacterium]